MLLQHDFIGGEKRPPVYPYAFSPHFGSSGRPGNSNSKTEGKPMVEKLLITENDADLRLVAVALGAPPDAKLEDSMARFFGTHRDRILAQLRSLGVELELTGEVVPALASDAPLESQIGDCHYLYVESAQITRAVIGKANNLAFIQKNGVDCRNIDLVAASELKITVKTLRRRANIAVADHTMLLMLAAARRLPAAHRAALAGKPGIPKEAGFFNWAKLDGLSSLWGKTLGLIGLGEIGREVALRAKPFGMRIVYFQRNRLGPELEDEFGAAYRSLPDLLAESDFVSLHLPLNENTHHLLGARELQRMRREAILINTSRGRLVDEAALLRSLRDGHLGGAGLDVRYDEPPERSDVLSDLDTVVLTPHVAAGTGEEIFMDAKAVLENIAAARRGAAHRS